MLELLHTIAGHVRKRQTANHAWSTDRHLHPSIEPLENRRLLAGNVNVRVTGINLRILGDGASNQIDVVSMQGDIHVIGSQGTSVRGGDTGIVANQLNNVTVRLRGGDDTLLIQPDVNVGGNLNVNMAAGSDFTRLIGNHVVSGTTTIRTGGGQDLFYADSVEFQRSFRMATGAGGDFVYLGGNNDTITFGGIVNVSTGSGDDGLEFADFTVFQFLATNNRLNGGSGFDNLYPMTRPFQTAYPNVFVTAFEF